MKFKKDYIRIQNLSQFLINERKVLHPDDPRHTKYWREIKRKVYEGMWGIEFGGYRYCPGRLYFYGNFGTILDVDKEQNTRQSIRPLIRDIEWERAYMLLEAEGFSGWSNDDVFTSDEWWFELSTKGLPSIIQINKWNEGKQKRYYNLIDKDGKLKQYITPRENIRKIHSEPMGLPLYWNPTKNISELGCLHKDTGVRMYDGSVKKASEIRVGDSLMGPDSKPRTVKELVRGSGIMYDVSTRYGETYRVTDSHVHRVRKHLRLPPSKKRNVWGKYTKDLNIDTNQILDIKEKSFKRDYEAIIQSIEYPEQNLKLHPYFIGYWLGDGFKREKLICYNEEDRKVIEPWFIQYANSEERFSYKIKNRGALGLGNKLMYQFRLIDSTMMYKNNWWAKTFRNNKHIPKEYLHSSREQRLQLLAGFIDSDGNYDKTRFKVFNSDLKLIKQLQDLCRSLGFKTTLNKRRGGIKNNISYYLQITGDIHLIPTKYPRKQATKPVTQGCRRNHINIDLSSGKVEDFYGFEVDKDHLFLLEDYTVTHNARSGGKSYWYAVGVCLHTIITDGAKYYNEETIQRPPKAEVCVGSGMANKSSDFCKKIEDAMNELATNLDLGAWGSFGEEDYEPSIFYKEMAGSIKPNNKENLWRHEYKVLDKGREITEGTSSYIAHVVYSPNKPDGAEAAAGGRYNILIYEEQGLLPLLIKAWGSNNSTVRVDSRQFGVQIALGTSGNMETVGPAKEIFTHPKDYNLVTFLDVWEETGEIGFFLPAYMTSSEHKDENGNTLYDEAIEYYMSLRAKAEEANNPHTLAINKMNNPMFPSDMWQQEKGNILPVAEAQAREKELLQNRNFEKNYTPVKLTWDSTAKTGVVHEVDTTKQPFFEHKYRYEREDLDGPIMIYEFPQEIKGEIPPDMYNYIGHDPYVSDRMDEGDSLGATYIIMNPKYSLYGYSGNCIVASYIGKPWGGRKEYYSNLEKLLAFYGNPTRGLWFEANRGDECKNYFVNRDKQHLLCLRPQNVGSASIYAGKITQYGYILGAGYARKAELMDKVAEWLLEENTIGEETKRNIERIPDIFLIRQIISFSMDEGNYDTVMALAGAILGMKENEKQLMEEINKKNNHNPVAFFSQNSKIFKNPDPHRNLVKRLSQIRREKRELDWQNEWELNTPSNDDSVLFHNIN